jgi:hypothetical protein
MSMAARTVAVLAALGLLGCWLQPYPTTQPAPRPTGGPIVIRPSGTVVQPTPAPGPVVTPMQPAQPAGPVQVRLVNASGIEVCYLYVSVAGDPWGDDQLGSEQTLPAGAEVVLELDGSIPYWDYKGEDCGHNVITDLRNQPIGPGVTWTILAPAGGIAVTPSGGYVATPTYDATPTPEPAVDTSSSSVAAHFNPRMGVVAAWYLGASSGDVSDLLNGDCGFIDNGDLQDFCRGDCGFIDNGDIQDLCRGDCGFIDDGDLQDFCRGDCGFIDNGDLQDLCRGDCGFIDDSGLADACRRM